MSSEAHDTIIIGAGISGLAFAFKASQAARKTLVLEGASRIGGCVHSVRNSTGFWYELGAHTVYNSYGAFLDIVVGTQSVGKLVGRGPARARFGLLREGIYKWLSPPRVLLQLNWMEIARSAPSAFFASKSGQTMSSYYSQLIGKKNYERVLAPFLAAVPSQSADGFPAQGPGSLFKTRARRKEFPRSFGLQGGLQSICDAVASSPHVRLETGVEVHRVRRTASGFSVETRDGRRMQSPTVVLAVPPQIAAEMTCEDFPKLSATLRRIRTVTVESLGVVLPREKAWMPECAFVVPVNDMFYSAVTRDPFADEKLRAFAFHFKPGFSRQKKLDRIAEVLRVPASELGEVSEARVTLPSPEAGHGELIAEIDAQLAGSSLAVTGNYFAGLAIEDCVLRSNSEWARLSARG